MVKPLRDVLLRAQGSYCAIALPEIRHGHVLYWDQQEHLISKSPAEQRLHDNFLTITS